MRESSLRSRSGRLTPFVVVLLSLAVSGFGGTDKKKPSDDPIPLTVPKALVEMEAQQLLQRAAQDLQGRGLKPEQLNLNPQQFEESAKRRVALGLIIAELARAENLQPKPAEVRALVEQEAQSYESPAEVVKWFYMQPQRLSEMEAMALEANVVKWVLSKAQVTEKEMAFDELMGAAGS